VSQLKTWLENVTSTEGENGEVLRALQPIQTLRQAKDSAHEAARDSTDAELSDMERLSARIHGAEYVPECAQIDMLREAVRELHKDVKKLKTMELGETSTSEEEKQEDSASGQGEIIENDDTMEPPAKRRRRATSLPMHKVPVGTRVKIKTTRFDVPGEPKYSEDKEEYEYGSVVKQLANKMQ